MKKYVKLTSLVLSLVMALACVSPAFAAGAPAEPRSEFAGQNKPVHLVLASPDGTVRQECDFEVAIPENATVATEVALTNAAARAQTGMDTATRAIRYAGDDLLSHRGPFTIAAAGTAQVVGGGTLAHNYDIIYVELYNVSIATANKFNIRIEGGGNNNVYSSKPYTGEGSYLFMIDNNYYGAGTLHLDKGKTIQVWASTDSGRLDVRDVYVSCSETY